jgi:SulP family sulfate permease
MHDVDDYAAGRQMPGLLVYRYDAPLFFANAEDFKRRALESVDGADPPVEWFLLNAEANTEVDLTGIDALEEVRQTLADHGIVFALARAKFELVEILTSTGFIGRIGRDRVFMTLPTAVEAYRQWYAARHGGDPPSSTSR